MPPSRSKLFRGRPNKLLIDDRAILIKMPDFQDAPELEDEDEQDEFLIGFSITENTSYHRVNAKEFGCAISNLNLALSTF